MLQTFIDSKYKLAYNGRYTTDEEITGMLIAVLFAGQHTSSVTSTWALLSMLANKVSLLCLLEWSTLRVHSSAAVSQELTIKM